MPNLVYIAMSLDGYIADIDDNLEWLTLFPNEDKVDYGYDGFIQHIDALVMGRRTFEFLEAFEEWPYEVPVFVLSNTMEAVADRLQDKVQIVKGDIQDVLQSIEDLGYNSLYIDGGTVIQSLLREDLIDEMTITIIPILLGGGSTLFRALNEHRDLKLLKSTTFSNGIVQNHYRVIT